VNNSAARGKVNPWEVIDYFLPSLAMAGDYALEIQARVQSSGDKLTGATRISRALTDADLSVQSLIEVAALARFPGFAYHTEELDRSLNFKYFPKSSDYLLALDPINGTLFYQDGLPIFDIILTLIRGREIVAVIDYIPGRQTYFMAIRGEGAFTTTRADALERRPWQTFRLGPPAEPVLVYRLDGRDQARLAESFQVVDLERDYRPPDWRYTAHSLLTGDVSAYVKRSAQLIDWGAVAFIAEQAGGAVSDFGGSPAPNFFDFPETRVPNLVAAASREILDQVVATLRG